MSYEATRAKRAICRRLGEPMRQAVRADDLVAARVILAQHLPVENLPIHEVLSTRSMGMFQLFLEHGWNINTPLKILKPPVLA